MSQPAEAPPRVRQRRNAPETKARIIAAAQQLFGAHGYGQAGLREIAARAGVSVSLLPLHFGSKAELFETALIEAMKSNPVLDGPRSGWGRRMVDHAMGEEDVRLPAMVVLSTGDAEAREIASRVLREAIIAELVERLGPPNARERAVEIIMISTGFLIYGRQLALGEIGERTKRRIARLLQDVIDETEPRA